MANATGLFGKAVIHGMNCTTSATVISTVETSMAFDPFAAGRLATLEAVAAVYVVIAPYWSA